MKIPKVIKRHCPHCKKHTEHTVSTAKKKGMGSVHTQSRGSYTRNRARGAWRGAGNQGRFSRKAMVHVRCQVRNLQRRLISDSLVKLRKGSHAKAG